MYPVSAAYKAASRAQIREAQAHARIYMGVFDAAASPDATLTFPAKTVYSTPANVNADVTITASYATFEPDRLRLDGKHQLLPDSAASYTTQGYVSAAWSGTDSVFPTPPMITIDFSVQHTLVGLTLTFDPVDLPPAQLTLLAYTGDTLASTTTITEISNPMQWELLLTDVDKLVIRFDKTATPQGRARLNRIEFGVGYSFQDKEIIEITEKHTDAPVSITLPSSSLSFALDNSDGRYSLDGDTALVRFLAAGQQVSVTYGLDVSGSVEWIPGGVWQLDSWDVDGTKAKFACIDAIAALTKTTYEKGVYDWDIHYLYDMAVAVFADAGITEYYIDPYLQSQYTSAPIPIVSHAEALQLIANRAKARLFVSRAGLISIECNVAADFVCSSATPAATFGSATNLSSSQKVQNIQYATFELDMLRLDGTQQLLPNTAPYLPAGWVVEAAGSNFLYPPNYIYLTYSAPTNVYSLTVDWGGPPPASVCLHSQSGATWSQPFWIYPTKQQETYAIYRQHITRLELILTRATRANIRPRILSISTSRVTDFVLDGTQIFDRQTGKLLTRLRKVTAQWIYRSFYPTVSIEVASTKVMTNSGWMRIEHDCCYAPTAAVDNSAVTIEQLNYAYVSYVRLTSATAVEVNLTITGKKLYEAAYPISSEGYDTGEDLPVDTALYDNSNIQSTLDWMRDYYSRRIEYQASCRGFPELDLADIITLEDGSTAQIIASELTYNGGFRQTLTYRK